MTFWIPTHWEGCTIVWSVLIYPGKNVRFHPNVHVQWTWTCINVKVYVTKSLACLEITITEIFFKWHWNLFRQQGLYLISAGSQTFLQLSVDAIQQRLRDVSAWTASRLEQVLNAEAYNGCQHRSFIVSDLGVHVHYVRFIYLLKTSSAFFWESPTRLFTVSFDAFQVFELSFIDFFQELAKVLRHDANLN